MNQILLAKGKTAAADFISVPIFAQPAIADRVIASPGFIDAPVFTGLISRHKAAAADTAFDLAGERITIAVL